MPNVADCGASRDLRPRGVVFSLSLFFCNAYLSLLSFHLIRDRQIAVSANKNKINSIK